MRLLLVEDKDSFRRMLVKAIPADAWNTTAVEDASQALSLLEHEPFDVLVTDLRLPGLSGLELLRKAKRTRPALRCVLMSAFGEPKDIVEAIRAGAEDFLPKPFDLDRFLALLEELRGLIAAPPPDPREAWVVQSPASRELDHALRSAAENGFPVLFWGEAGVGRSRAARRLHVLSRPGRPFLVLDASQVGNEGFEQGFRFARGGSLCIQGLERLSHAQGAQLRQAMDSPPGRDLRWMASALDPAELPQELGLAFGVLRFRMVPLRERKEDILPLLHAFFEGFAKAEGRPLPIVDRSVDQEALAQEWPGHARELAATAAATLHATEGLRIRHLVRAASEARMVLPWPPCGNLESMLHDVREHAESLLLRRSLEACGGQAGPAAEALGLTLRVLGQRLREHGIPLDS